MANLSESAPIAIEDPDSIFADLDQIINGASFQAAATAAEKSQSGSDKATPSQEEIAKAKVIFKNCLPLDFKFVLHPCRRGLFLEAISTLSSFSDFPSDKIFALERFLSDFPSLASKFESSERELEEYQRLIDSKVSLAEILKVHAAAYKTLKTKEELIDEDIKALREQLELKEEEKKKIISKKQNLAEETQVKKLKLAEYNSNAPSWMKKMKKAKGTSSRVVSSWDNFRKNFV